MTELEHARFLIRVLHTDTVNLRGILDSTSRDTSERINIAIRRTDLMLVALEGFARRSDVAEVE